MTSEGLGEMFEGDSADTGAGKFLLMSIGVKRRVSRAQTRERGPHRCERKFYTQNENLKLIYKKCPHFSEKCPQTRFAPFIAFLMSVLPTLYPIWDGLRCGWFSGNYEQFFYSTHKNHHLRGSPNLFLTYIFIVFGELNWMSIFRSLRQPLLE